MSQPDISVIIVNWNTSELLLKCLASLPWQSRELKLEVIVVDNASTDNSAGLVEMTFPRCTVIRNALNLGFAAG
ncbi:MAG: glycosyltransferase, partial [Kiritimatiellia bacterium]